jgi:DNA-binding transcriptional LysR family regulator
MPSPVNFRTLDLNLLRVFDVVMDERNVTRAAERLSMTQPAVSNAMRRLRDATREELFVAGSTGVTPTDHAQSLWPAVRHALRHLREALEPRTFDPRTDARSFDLAMADANAVLTAPRLAATLRSLDAEVDLRFLPLTTRDPRTMLEHGEADLAVGFFPDVAAALAAEGSTSALQLDRLYECEYVSVMRREHPLAADGLLDLDAFCSAGHLRVSFAGRPRGFVDEALARFGRERRTVITVNQFFTAGAVVARSDLLTVLPRSFVPATGFADELAVRPLPFEMPAIEVGLLWHRRHEHDPAQRWLRERVTEVSQEIAAEVAADRAAAPAPAAARPAAAVLS